MDELIDKIIDMISEVDIDIPESTEIIDRSLDTIVDSLENAASSASQITSASTVDLSEITENLSRNTAILTNGITTDPETDLSAMFETGDTHSQITFTGASQKDRAFQEFKSILSEHNQSIPYSKIPTFIGDSIGAASASNLEDYIRDLYKQDKINASTENKLMELIDRMR